MTNKLYLAKLTKVSNCVKSIYMVDISDKIYKVTDIFLSENIQDLRQVLCSRKLRKTKELLYLVKVLFQFWDCQQEDICKPGPKVLYEIIVSASLNFKHSWSTSGSSIILHFSPVFWKFCDENKTVQFGASIHVNIW